MPSTNILDKLKLQHNQLGARIQQIEATKKCQEKKADTRRKILIGAYYLDKAKKENTLDDLNKLMDSFLERASDRRVVVWV